MYLNVYPLFTSEDRAAWETYSAQNDGWVKEAIEIQKSAESYNGPILEIYDTWSVIHGYDEYEKDDHSVGTTRSGPYLPSWQESPVM